MKSRAVMKCSVIICTVLFLLFIYLIFEAVEGVGELFTSISDSIKYDRAVKFILNEEYEKGKELLNKMSVYEYKDSRDFRELCNFAFAVKNEREFSTRILDIKEFRFCSSEQKAAVKKLISKLKEEYAPIRERIEEERAKEAEAQKEAEARARASLKSKVPFVGMSEQYISSTSLGSYRSKSTQQYFSVGKNHSYNVYYFSDGKRDIFRVRCEMV